MLNARAIKILNNNKQHFTIMPLNEVIIAREVFQVKRGVSKVMQFNVL
jgi:hypothetical protein